jgi:hypothetical protein
MSSSARRSLAGAVVATVVLTVSPAVGIEELTWLVISR